jgi:hypothetical protein
MTPGSATLQRNKNPMVGSKVQTTLKKKLQSQMEGTVSRNDNNPTKITGGPGIISGSTGSIGAKKSVTTTVGVVKKKK